MESYGPLVGIANKLQDAFSTLGYQPLSLPQIAVVGGQSAGKSSVLENVVGADFLPRGSGICTRRPLVLQLQHVASLKSPYGVFLHKPDVKFHDFNNIRTEIERETDKVTGTNKGISDIPINLKIYSPTVTNLTLIDLPGITKVPVGDQPDNVEEIIEGMVLKYIKDPNCIILAVHPAPHDLANSQALATARKVDPKGMRTVGVLTKLDLMTEGSDVSKVLEGKFLPLKLGYIAVVNRSQKDIQAYKKISEQWKSENLYFSTHPVYRRFKSKCGTQYLTKSLSKLLATHIRRKLPEIEGKVREFMRDKREQLAGMQTLGSEKQKLKYVLETATDYAKAFDRLIEGRSEEVSSDELQGGAKIASIFTQSFVKSINAKELDILYGTSAKEIETTIRNCMGMRAGLFVPDASFEVIIRRAIKRLNKPAQQCVSDVYEVLISIVDNLLNPNMKRYNGLAEEVHAVAKDLICQYLSETQTLVKTLIDMELVRISTDHPDFSENRSTVQMVIANMSAQDQEVETRRRRQSMYAVKSKLKKDIMQSTSPSNSRGRNGDGGAKVIMSGWIERQESGFMGEKSVRYFGAIRGDRFFYMYKTKDAFERSERTARRFDLTSANVQAEASQRVRIAGLVSDGKSVTEILHIPSNTDFIKWNQMLLVATNDKQWDAIAKASKKKKVPPPPPVPRKSVARGVSPRSADDAASKSSTPESDLLHVSPDGFESMGDGDDPQAIVIRRLLGGYFNIIRKKIRDSVPKAITLCLIEKSRTKLHSKLIAELYSPTKVNAMLEESEEAALERERVLKALTHMESAMKAIEEVRKFS